MSMNKILTNVNQSLTTAEKETARNNIDASTINVINPATAYGGDLEFNYNNNTNTYQVKVDNNLIANLLPTANVSGKYLQTDSQNHIVWDNLPPTHATYTKTVYAKNEQQNTNVLGYYFLDGQSTDIEGIVQFVPDTNGTYSVCPFSDSNSNAYYTSLGYQSTNSPSVNAGDVVTLPFHFFADGQYVCPTVVGIKGSDSSANITPYNIIINHK